MNNRNKYDFNILKEKYYYLELNVEELKSLFCNNNFISYDDFDNFIGKLISLILNNECNNSLIKIDRNKLLSNFAIGELLYSDDIFDNLYQLRKLYPFFDEIKDQDSLLLICNYIINSSQVLRYILENVFKCYPQLDFNDSYLMLMIDAYTNRILNDSKNNDDCELGDNYSIYKKDVSNLDDISDGERQRLLVLAKNGDENARKRFIESNLKLVLSIARYYQQYANILDLIQSGNLGLIEAYDKFDIDKGYRFSTYAVYWIRREIIVFLNNIHPLKLPRNIYYLISKIKKAELELINANKPVTSKTISIKTGIELSKVDFLRNVPLSVSSIDEPVSDESDASTVGEFISSDVDVEEDVISKLNRQQVYDIVMEMINDNFIDKREADILLMRNGFINDKIFTYEEIGKEYNISKQRVDQIYTVVLRKIRRSRYRFRLAQCLEDEQIKRKILGSRIII